MSLNELTIIVFSLVKLRRRLYAIVEIIYLRLSLQF